MPNNHFISRDYRKHTNTTETTLINSFTPHQTHQRGDSSLCWGSRHALAGAKKLSFRVFQSPLEEVQRLPEVFNISFLVHTHETYCVSSRQCEMVLHSWEARPSESKESGLSKVPCNSTDATLYMPRYDHLCRGDTKLAGNVFYLNICAVSLDDS